MNTKRDYIAEISAKRKRSEWHPTSSPRRLFSLKQAFDHSPRLDPEFLRYFPIAYIAIVEAFFRDAIKALVDNGPPHFDNLAASPYGKELKFDLLLVKAITGQTVTIGDLFSHLIPIKSFEGIGGVMDTALGKPFFKEVASAVNRHAVEVHGAPAVQIVTDFAKTAAILRETFSFRHIYAHEMADSHLISRAFVEEMLTRGKQFLDATAEVMSNTLYPNAPLTQEAMTDAAAEDFRQADALLNAVDQRLLALLDDAARSKYEAVREAFTKYRSLHCDFETFEIAGSMAPLFYHGEATFLTRERANAVEGSHYLGSPF